MTEVVVVLRLEGDDPAALKDRMTEVLRGVEGAEVKGAELDAALGMTMKEVLLTVTLGFATSVSANYATRAIDDALANSRSDQVTVEEILCEENAAPATETLTDPLQQETVASKPDEGTSQ